MLGAKAFTCANTFENCTTFLQCVPETDRVLICTM